MGPTTTIEFYYSLRLINRTCTMRDTNRRDYRRDLSRWVAQQIAELGTDTFWIKGNKSLLCFAIKFWWAIVRH